MLNVQGLCGKRYNKLNSPELKHVFENNHIILLTETWTNDYSEIHVDGFEEFVLNRTLKCSNAKRDSGGIIIYVSDKMANSVSLIKKVSDCLLWLRISGNMFDLEDDVYLGLCYNAPEGSGRVIYDERNIFDTILQDIVSFENLTEGKCNIFVCGDLNARTGTKSDYVENETAQILDLLPDDYILDQPLPRYSEDSVCNEYGNCLLDLCKSTGLRIVNGRLGDDKYNGKYTCIKGNGKSVVDYVLCKPEIFRIFSSFIVEEPNILSDHCMIKFSFSCYNIGNVIELDQEVNSQKFTYKWDETKKLQYIEQLNQTSTIEKINNLTNELDSVVNDEDLDDNLKVFYKIVDNVCGPLFKKNLQCGYKKTTKSNLGEPWFDDNCRNKRKFFHNRLNTYRNDKNEHNRKCMTEARTDYKGTIREAKYKFDRNKTAKLEKARFQNAREYWKLLKNLNPSTKTHSLSANNFAQYFKAINDPNEIFFQPDEDVIFFNERYINGELQVMFDELNVSLTEEEIMKAIKQLKLGKSCGPDYMLNEFFRYGMDVLMPYLYKLFNTVFNLGYFPEKWTEGFIVPLHKKGNSNDVENYRGITLLSTFGKLFTRILNNRLNNWAENYHIYIDAQAGFRKHMGTIDNIFVMHSLIKHFINEGKRLYAALIDFTKAFDYVVRENLWLKLIKTGVRGKMLDVIMSMYKCVKSVVKYDNCLSEEFSCFLGVRQGECLSPFLFSIYLNDIETEFVQNGCKGVDIGMLKVFLLLYADDIVIFSPDENGLQKGLDVLHGYCSRWKLKVNTNKTKIMILEVVEFCAEIYYLCMMGNQLR